MINVNKQGQPDRYLFVIDTDSYAGNFERQMCAYVTGQLGECEVGEENTELAKREIPEIVSRLEDMVELVPDEHGCSRPVDIFPTPGWFNNGVGGHFRDGQEKEALAHYKKETKRYNNEAPKQYAENLRGKVRKEYQQKTKEAMALTEVEKYPAYFSVAIYFNTIPDKDIIEVMKKRARTIAARGVGLKGYEEVVKIVGFRFLEQHTTFNELKI